MSNDVIYSDMEEIFKKEDWEVFSGKTILITGAYGMLASYLTYFFIYLREDKLLDITLVLLVRSENKLRRCIGYRERAYIKVYESNLENLPDIDEEIDYIIHAASLASPQHYSVRPVDVLMPHSIGTFNLLKLARLKDVKGFLLFSTGDVYGRVDGTERITEYDFGVMDTLDIHNCYSESKRMAETMCYSFFKQYDVPVKIARIWHTYSPTMDENNDPRVFSSFVKNVVSGENIVMRSDGSGKRAFCYITDAVYGFFKIMIDGLSGEAYNVCNESQFVSVLELANIIVNLRPQKQLKIIAKKRKADDNYVENIHLAGIDVCPSSEKLRLLGWKPDIDLQTGFDRVFQYKGI